jgi:1-acyl-sn-glycerol-3-phosphate acyltransferase
MSGVEQNSPPPLDEPATDRQSSWPPDHRNGVYWFLQTCVQLVAPVYFRYRARGMENVPAEGAALLVANHQSFLDPVFAGLPFSRPLRFLARSTLYRGPLLTFVFNRLCAIPVNRDAAGSGTIRVAAAHLQQGHLVGIFPEGTRSVDGRLGPLKPGFIALLRRAEVPIIPVGLAGTGAAFPRGSWFIRPRKCRVVYGPPLQPEVLAKLKGRGSEEALLEVVRDAMTRCYDEAREWQSR